MKRLFRIFELSVNEQRIVLIIMFGLLAFAFIGYERRVHHSPVASPSSIQTKPSPTAAESGW